MPGCELPESLRRYYLDAMGIQAWEQQAWCQPIVSEMAPAAVESVPVEDRPEKIEPTEAERWSMLQATVTACRACELHAGRQQALLGAGNPEAELMLLGAAPSQEEDLLGEVFVGDVGELLDAMLKAIGLDRHQVYISTVLKCMLTDDRPISVAERNACLLYLQQQIALLKPKVILVFGQNAAQALLDTNEDMHRLRSQQYQFGNILVMASHHPAELLKNPVLKRESWHDLQKLKQVLDKCQ